MSQPALSRWEHERACKGARRQCSDSATRRQRMCVDVSLGTSSKNVNSPDATVIVCQISFGRWPLRLPPPLPHSARNRANTRARACTHTRVSTVPAGDKTDMVEEEDGGGSCTWTFEKFHITRVRAFFVCSAIRLFFAGWLLWYGIVFLKSRQADGLARRVVPV